MIENKSRCSTKLKNLARIDKLKRKGKSKEDDDYDLPVIVVFIDDLDRCFPDKAVELLEGIKVVLNQPRFAFVLGINDKVIREYIKTKYQKDYNIGFDSDYYEDYLDKIIQVEIRVPPMADNVKSFIDGLLKEAGVQNEFLKGGISKEKLYPLIAHAGKGNPRAIVRLINGLIVTWKIEGGEFGLMLLLVHYVMTLRDDKVFMMNLAFPKKDDTGKEVSVGEHLAEALGTKGVQQADNHQLRIEFVKNHIEGLKFSMLNKTVEVLEKNPHLCEVLMSEAGREWLKDKEKRAMLGRRASVAMGGVSETIEQKTADKQLDDSIRQLLENMVPIKGGSFQMGSEKGEDIEKPVHQVTVDGFDILKTPVTQAQYKAVMGENPSALEGPGNPVENVCWHDAMAFCEKLSRLTDSTFTLPTEAQWEYACRAGSKTEYYFGDDPGLLDKYAWYEKNSMGKTHPVEEKEPNAFNLYDMHGNVWEWCLDGRREYTKEPQNNPVGPIEANAVRVLRGGGWFSLARVVRSACRVFYRPVFRIGFIGFRCLRVQQ